MEVGSGGSIVGFWIRLLLKLRRCSKHEISGSPAGHTVILSNPGYADLVHTIGVASLAADDKQIWHLIKLYWYTVEFGVVREENEIKAFGAGSPYFNKYRLK